eukprot:gene1333-1511_t
MLAYCYKGDTERARQLLEANWTSVDELDENGRTALMWATLKGHEETMIMLLDNGAAIDIQDEGGLTALMFSCGVANINVTRLLLDRGANIRIKDKGEVAYNLRKMCLKWEGDRIEAKLRSPQITLPPQSRKKLAGGSKAAGGKKE